MEFKKSLERQLELALHSSIEEVRNVFEKIYKEYAPLVFYIINKRVKCLEDCEELTNDVFVNFFNKINTFDTSRSIKYCLMSTAENKAIDFLKSKKEEYIPYEDNICGDNYTSNKLILNLTIDEWKEVISDFEIEIIVGHIIYDCPFRELSEEFGININTIKSTYKRAIIKLRKYLESKGINNKMG